MKRARRDAIAEALAAATGVANDWLAAGPSQLTLRLEDVGTIRAAASGFVLGAKRRKVDWDWTRLYHKEVRGRAAWLFSLRRGHRPLAMCLGTIKIREDHVAVEMLERRPYSRGMRGGLVVAVTFQFAAAVANALGIGQVRFVDPLNEKLARYYETMLGMTPVRQPAHARLNYLFKNVKVQP